MGRYLDMTGGRLKSVLQPYHLQFEGYMGESAGDQEAMFSDQQHFFREDGICEFTFDDPVVPLAMQFDATIDVHQVQLVHRPSNKVFMTKQIHSPNRMGMAFKLRVSGDRAVDLLVRFASNEVKHGVLDSVELRLGFRTP